MPSHKSVKTYEKRTRLQMNRSAKSVDAINALFAENLTKRLKSQKRGKVEIKELPPRSHAYLTNDSLEVDVDNTFDKVLKGKVYNEVKKTDVVRVESDSDSKVHTSASFSSPIITRLRKKRAMMNSEISNSESSVLSEKSSTLDKPVTKSLSVEKENKALSKSSLSYITLPKIMEIKEIDTLENVYKPIFSDTFRERQTVHSSTPCMMALSEKIVADPLSPITKSDSSTSSQLMEKSYDQIRKWDEKFPGVKTPQRKTGVEIKEKRRKLSTILDDWKLYCQPKVYINQLDLNTDKQCKTKSLVKNEDLDFLGFTQEEQSTSSKVSRQMQIFLMFIEEGRGELDCQPKVYKSYSDLNIKEKRRKNEDLHFCGFSKEEQSKSSNESSQVQIYLKSFDSRGELTETLLKLKKSNSEDLVLKNNLRRRRRRRRRSGSRCSKVPKKLENTPHFERNLRPRKSRRNPLKSHPHLNIPRHDKLCINVTADILSEKEVSYSNSSSFDFTSSSSSSSLSKIKYTTEELKQEKEVILPKTPVKNLTFDLKDFDNFMQSYYGRHQETENRARPSVQSIEMIDDSEIVPPQYLKPHLEIADGKTEPQITISQEISKRVNTQGSPSQESKIIILSDISLGHNYSIVGQKKNVENVLHDHSYSDSPKYEYIDLTDSVSQLEKSVTCLSDIIESSVAGDSSIQKIAQRVKQKPIKLKPGKPYRRSLSLLKRSSLIVDVKNSICNGDCICLKCLFKKNVGANATRSQIVPVNKEPLYKSILESYARSSCGYVQSEEDCVDNLDDSVRNLSLNERRAGIFNEGLGNFEVVTAKEVLLRRCGQTEVLPFEECYPRSALQNCQKIGEGVFGEVFLYRNQNGGTTVMKIIPIEGDLIVNGEQQKKFEEILSEIVITMELSNLRENKKNTTSAFVEVQRVRYTQGSYPDRLLDLWELYDETKGSDNDSPQIFPTSQRYVVLELANAGQDVESFVFANAQQAFSMFKQTACALAIAESELKFEHRDLHWGNILVGAVDKTETLRYRLNGKEIEVESCGVKVSIIDFTVSRMEIDGVIIFHDISRDDELFAAHGDYQFEIYRLMQKSNGNEWQHFEPYTNVLWLHYLLDKVPVLRYKNPRSKIHQKYLKILHTLKKQVLSFNSVADFVKDKFV